MTGEELRKWRKGIGLSQSEVAERLGLKQNTVSRWERGLCAIRHPVLVASAIALLEERLYAEEAAKLETRVWVECMKTYIPLDDVRGQPGYAHLSLTQGTTGSDVLLYVCPVCLKKHAGSVVSP